MRLLLRPRSCGSGRPRLGPRLVLGLALGMVLGCESAAPREVKPAAAQHAPAAEEVDAPTSPRRDVHDSIPAVTRSPASLEALPPGERRRYHDALAEGRRLHAERDHVGAMEAFARALDVLPGDPRTLSEQGWAALHADKLVEAEAALQQAEAAVLDDDAELHASILYNRGRVAEARGDAVAALRAYQASLRLRPHPAAYQHLVALPGGTRYVFGPQVQRLQGPYARLAELCAEERTLSEAAGEGEEGEAFGCLSDAAKGLGGDAVEVPAGKRLPAPWTGLRFVETRPSPYVVRFHAALRTEAGWFVLPDVAVLSRGTAGTTERATRLAARVEPLFFGGAPEVVLEVETRWVVTEDAVERESETHGVEFLCGVGPSGIPSCTGALPRAMKARRREASGVEHTRWSVERRARPEGVVVLEGDAEALDEPVAAVLGAHRIELP